MRAHLTVHLLGQTTILLDGQPVTGLTSRTAEALLIYLICRRRPFLRSWLADFFWDERSPQQAATNLRTVLSMLRKALGHFLLISRDSVAFSEEAPYWLDVAQFEEGLAAVMPAAPEGEPLTEETAGQLQAVLDLYQGNFLEGYFLSESRGFEEWTLLTQERLRRLASSGLRRLVGYYLDTGHYGHGIDCAGRLLALEPYDENARRQMMWLLVRSGQRHAALQQYQACRQLLAQELAVEPAPATTAVFEQIRALSFPPPCHLPVQATPFVGREEELRQVSRLLSQASCHLLSILGPGGTGKTRLAVEVASHFCAQRPGSFLDGVYFIPLAAVESAAYLPPAIAESLGFTFHGAADPAGQLVDFLRQKELLLVLDNLEQLLAQEEETGAKLAADLFARILAQAPRVKLVATTRQRLNLVEEWLFDLEGLNFPTDVNAAEPEEYSAVRLFLQSARRLQPAFAPAADDWAAIIRLCQLLEGMPLGLELASAWVRQLSCVAIVAQVAESPATLATSYHNVPGRHRSLAAVFAHSWKLLTVAEQAVFQRLAVFRGGFTAAAATAVSGADAAMLAALVDKSLLRLESPAARYDMHNLLRQFAAEKLRLSPLQESETVAEHGRYFASLLSRKESALKGAGERSALDELRADLPNLRTAWSWATAVAAADTGPLAAMIYSLAYLHDVQGLYLEGVNLFQEAAERLDSFAGAGAPVPESLARQHGRVLTWLGRFLYHVDRYQEARGSLQTAANLFRSLEAQEELALALTNLGEVARFENEFNKAQQHQLESLKLAQAAASNEVQALALLHLGKIHTAEGQYEEARRVYRQGLAVSRESGSLRQIAVFEDNLGTVALELGDYEVAREMFEAAYALRHDLDDRWGLAVSVNNLGVLASATGEYNQAEEKYRQAATWFRHIGHRWGVAMALTNLGKVLSDRGDYEAATKSLRQAFDLWQELGSQLGESDALYYLGQVAYRRHAFQEAKSYYEQSLAFFAELDNDRQTAIVWRDLGVVLLHLGDLPAARRYLRQSLELALRQQIVPDVLYALSGWAHWLEQQGESAVAVQLLTLVARHPLTWQQEKEEAEALLARLSPGLSPSQFAASQEKGSEMSVDDAVRLLSA
jgi:DNA-binding SARP family transcriptional activator/predicted ATPase/Tfp pilus assembly protein PilF